MAIILNGTTGITTPDIDSTAGFDGATLTGDVAAARITGALNATGSAPIYACRAWVNFNGTGDVAIRASGNVSSITDNGPGDYTVNFATAMQDGNYASVCTGFVVYNQSGTYGFGPRVTLSSNEATTKTTTQLRVLARRESDRDIGEASVSIFR